jgi:hypothetical protein
MKMSLYYIHSEVLLFYYKAKKRNEREKMLGKKKRKNLSILKIEITSEP